MTNVLAFPARLHCKRVNGPWTSGTAAAPGSQIMQTAILIMLRGRGGQEFNVIAYCLYIQTWRNNEFCFTICTNLSQNPISYLVKHLLKLLFGGVCIILSLHCHNHVMTPVIINTKESECL